MSLNQMHIIINFVILNKWYFYMNTKRTRNVKSPTYWSNCWRFFVNIDRLHFYCYKYKENHILISVYLLLLKK